MHQTSARLRVSLHPEGPSDPSRPRPNILPIDVDMYRELIDVIDVFDPPTGWAHCGTYKSTCSNIFTFDALVFPE